MDNGRPRAAAYRPIRPNLSQPAFLPDAEPSRGLARKAGAGAGDAADDRIAASGPGAASAERHPALQWPAAGQVPPSRPVAPPAPAVPPTWFAVPIERLCQDKLRQPEDTEAAWPAGAAPQRPSAVRPTVENTVWQILAYLQRPGEPSMEAKLSEVAGHVVLTLERQFMQVSDRIVDCNEGLISCLARHGSRHTQLLVALHGATMRRSNFAAASAAMASALALCTRPVPAAEAIARIATIFGLLAQQRARFDLASYFYVQATEVDAYAIPAWLKQIELLLEVDAPAAKDLLLTMVRHTGCLPDGLFLADLVARRAGASQCAERFARQTIAQFGDAQVPAGLWYLLAKALEQQGRYGEASWLQWQCDPRERAKFLRYLGPQAALLAGNAPGALTA